MTKPFMADPALVKTYERYLSALILKEATRPCYFDRFLTRKPWPWWRRYYWRFVQHPLLRLRHSVCCGRECGDD